NDVAVGWIDPEILVIVSTRSTAETGPGLAPVGGAHGDGAGDVNQVRIFWINSWDGKVTSADAARRPRVGSDLGPGVARVIGAIYGQFPRGGSESRVETARIAGS